MGISSIVEGLRLVPGVDPRARGPRDVQTDFSIRGATFGQTLVLFDGLRLNDSQSGHHNGDIRSHWRRSSASKLSRERIVGTNGADALACVINVIPRSDPPPHSRCVNRRARVVRGPGVDRPATFCPPNWTLTGWFQPQFRIHVRS
jgi:iron complex outermembrane receptor protein